MANNMADAVIIGGGVHGCATAYYLAKAGCKRVVLLEKGYLASGGTGRSGAGIRHQFGTEINIRLSSAAVRMMENLEQELEYPRGISLMQKGYLIIAYTETQMEQFAKNVQLQREIDPENLTEILTTEEINRKLPFLNVEGVLGGTFNRRDGHANPFHVVQAFAEAAKRLGVDIRTFTEVVDIRTDQGKVTAVVTDKGEVIQTPVVVNCAGPHGAVVSKMAGVDIPLYPQRHQVAVTEPLEMFLPCMVLDFTHGTWFKQTPDGSLILGVGDPEHEVKEINQRCTWEFMKDVAEKMVFHIPRLKDVVVVRQWAGLYDMTPDSQAILGATPVEGFYLDVGWSGHGFQLGPIVGKIMAELISGQKPCIDVSCMSLERFEKGELIPEPNCV